MSLLTNIIQNVIFSLYSMINHHNITTITDLRFKTNKVLKKASKNPVFVFNHSKPQGVLLSIKEYERLMDELEDYHLSLKAQEYEKEDKSKVKWFTHEEVERELGL